MQEWTREPIQQTKCNHNNDKDLSLFMKWISAHSAATKQTMGPRNKKRGNVKCTVLHSGKPVKRFHVFFRWHPFGRWESVNGHLKIETGVACLREQTCIVCLSVCVRLSVLPCPAHVAALVFGLAFVFLWKGRRHRPLHLHLIAHFFLAKNAARHMEDT